MKIDGAVAIVTGGASGIGHAFCVALLENGAASVTILDICKDEGEKVQQQLEAQYGPGSAKFTECDVTNKEQLEKAFKQTVTDHGRLDILCNNAGVSEKENSMEKTVAINLVAVLQGTYLGMEIMKSGVIVNTSSMAGLFPISSGPVYSATKQGVVGFTRSIAPISLKKGIRVNCICPGVVDTPLVQRGIRENPVFAELVKQFIMMKPEFVAKGLIELIQDDTKNGEAMTVDAEHGIAYHEFTTKAGV